MLAKFFITQSKINAKLDLLKVNVKIFHPSNSRKLLLKFTRVYLIIL